MAQKWLLFDFVQERFITLMNPNSMKMSIRVFRTKEAADAMIQREGFGNMIMAIQYKAPEHFKILSRLKREHYRVEGIDDFHTMVYGDRKGM
jgi:hypothetical protein